MAYDKIECEICHQICASWRGLTKHLFYSHKEVTKEAYYLSYINPQAHVTCIDCSSPKVFHGLSPSRGYQGERCLKCSQIYGAYIQWTPEKRLLRGVEVAELNRKRWKDPTYKDTQTSRLSTLMSKTNNLWESDFRDHRSKNMTELNQRDTTPARREKVRLSFNSGLYNRYLGVHLPTQVRFDSGLELYFIHACYLASLPITRSVRKCKYLDSEGVAHTYTPDFDIGNSTYEIKGIDSDVVRRKRESFILAYPEVMYYLLYDKDVIKFAEVSAPGVNLREHIKSTKCVEMRNGDLY